MTWTPTPAMAGMAVAFHNAHHTPTRLSCSSRYLYFAFFFEKSTGRIGLVFVAMLVLLNC